ncbi:MAG TPA: hypothetical protein VIE46_11450, partial [Gemmatimonadales bacterium]
MFKAAVSITLLTVCFAPPARAADEVKQAPSIAEVGASPGIASGAQKLGRVTLSVREPRRENRAEVVRRGVPWVLSLRVVDPGRLVVMVGEQVLAECGLSWGEDERLWIDPVVPGSPSPLPRLVNRQVGQEEVEVFIPAELDAGALLTLTYEWSRSYQGQPALVRTWPLQPSAPELPGPISAPAPDEEDEGEDAARQPFAYRFPTVKPELKDPPARPSDAATGEVDDTDEARAALAPSGDDGGGDDGEEDSPSIAEAPPAPSAEDDDPLAPPAREQPVAYHVSAAEPEQLVLPAGIPRARIAEQLFGDATRQGAFDVVPSSAAGAGEQAIRPRDFTLLVPAATQQVRAALEAALAADVTWMLAKLGQGSTSQAEQFQRAEQCLRWSQRSDIRDAGGTSYFDRYLSALTAAGLERLLSEAGDSAEQLRKAIALRSRFNANYTVTDRTPLAPGDVVGRFYWDRGTAAGTGVPLQVTGTLVVESTFERAETATRNASYLGMRIVVPGGNGRFYGYRAGEPPLDLSVQGPSEGASGHFYWYPPGTVFIRAGEFRADFPEGTAADRQHRHELLARALSRATAEDPSAVLGLDSDALATATFDERVALLDLVLDAPDAAGEAGAGLLARTLLATPAGEFARFERRMSTGGVLRKLLALPIASIAALGRVFTLKTLASLPMGGDALTRMEAIQIGRTPSGGFRYAWGVDRPVDSAAVAQASWAPTEAPRIGREPALPGEAAGLLHRTGIAFQLGVSNSALDRPPIEQTTRAFLPTELVRIEVLGDPPQTVIVTALEAAGLAAQPVSQLITERGRTYVNTLLWAQTGAGLLRAFGPAIAEGLAAGSVRVGMTEALVIGGSAAGRQAVRSFAFQATLL